MPRKDKLILEYDEHNADNIAEEILNKLIQKIKKKDSVIRELNNQAISAQDFKETSPRLKEKLNEKK